MLKSDTAWHHIALSKLFKEINSSDKGLSQEEAQKRLEKEGFNLLAKADKFSAFDLFFSQFKSALVYVLIIAGFISVFFGEYIDAYVIFAAVMINVVVGFVQEFKANKSLEKLNNIVKKESLVIRDGIEQKIESKFLVPGDVIVLEAGNRVPADARLLEINDFEVNEATLTGESWPVKKEMEVLEVGTVLAERKNMVFMGTLVVEGRARAMVVTTGFNTEMGRITVMLKETKEDKTPLQKRLDSFAKNITQLIIVICLFLFVFGIYKGHPWQEMFTLAVAVAVSAIPEGLVISMTMILTVGMQRILRRQGLVRRLVSAETLGSTTVICTDKTGTLTEGEMRVTSIATANIKIDLAVKSLRELENSDELDYITKIAFFCNDAVVQNPESPAEDWIVLGSPTEKALMIFGFNDPKMSQDRKKLARIGEVPFDHQRKFMVTRHSYDNKQDILFIKGAPEKILSYSSQYQKGSKVVKMTKVSQAYFDNAWQSFSKEGLRVLAGAYKLVPKKYNIEKCKEDPSDFIFVGVWGLSDPLRKETKETLKSTLAAGINTVIITGDNKFTARSIARELGLDFKDDSIVTGDELLKMTDQELADRIRSIKVYARVSPADKLRIIKAWQNKGEIVSMTGDGVNDAPALKAANIGVAVSSGSDVAKETADLVLLDNNFKTIVMAIKQGRLIFSNIKKVVLYLLSNGLSEVITLIGSIILQIPMPLLAAQILWVNLVSDGLPALALTMEPEEEEIMNKKPKKEISLLDLEGKVLILIVSLITGLANIWLFWFFYNKTGNEDLARTVTFTSLGFSTLFYIFSIKSLNKIIIKDRPFRNKHLNMAVLAGAALQLAAVYLPFLNNALRTVPIGWLEWEIILLVILAVVLSIELVKIIFIHYYNKRR